MITTGRIVSVLLTATAVGLGVFAWVHRGKPETGHATARVIPAPPRVEASTPPERTPAPPAPTAAAPPATIRPSFDLIRVERNGDAVVAGLSGPAWQVELLSSGEVLGRAVANGDGEWVIIPDRPLAKKDQVLTIRAVSPDGKSESTSEQSVVVGALGEPGKPIVLLDEPEKAGAIIQAPPVMMALAPEDGSENQPVRTPSRTASPVRSLPSLPPATGDPVIGKPVRSQERNEAADVEPPDSAPTTARTASDFERPSSTPAAPETLPSASARVEIPSSPSAKAVTSPPAPAEIEMPPPPPVDPGGAVRDPPPDVVEPSVPPAIAHDPPRPGPETVSPSPPVNSLAESRDIPPAIAAAPPDDIARPEPPTIEHLAIETVEYEERGKLTITGKAGAGVILRAYLNDTWLRDVPAGTTDAFSIAFEALLATGHYRIRIDSVEAQTGRVLKRVEVPFERDPELDTATGAAPVRLGEARVFGGVTTGKEVETAAEPKVVIVKRGDNLWRISRKSYGAGRRYTTIYQANRDQIRDPGRIYPKQIFVIPQRN